MAVFTRRNAVVGWGVIQGLRMRRRMKKMRSADLGRQGKSLVALAIASIAGALAFKRSRRSAESKS